MDFGDPSGNRTHNLLIKRYFGLSAVAHRVEVRAIPVQLSCEKAVIETHFPRPTQVDALNDQWKNPPAV
jgi:hypothetical protein